MPTRERRDFCSVMARLLAEGHWGTIEPCWFDPEFPGLTDDMEEREWAEQLQVLVDQALREHRRI